MRTCRGTLFLLLIVLLVPVSSQPATAGTLAGVTLPDKAQVGADSLVLNGMALRKKFFVKVYVAGLYLQHKEGDAEKILAADGPRRMEMDFLYGVSPSQMCDAWKEGLEANTPGATAPVKKGFDTLCSWMEDIPKGQKLVLTYAPGAGTQVEIKGKVKGTLEGKPTADAILATWIGPNPAPGADFKAGVLGH